MKLLYLIVIISFFFNIAYCDPNVQTGGAQDKILTIVPQTFEQVINTYSHLLVAFYDPKCAQCKSLEPEFSEVANLVADDHSIKLAKFDATQDQDLIKALQIRNFPTFFLFRKGFRILYSGGLIPNLMVEWLKEKSASPTTEITSFEDLQAFQVNHKDNVQIVGYFKNPANTLLKDLKDAAYHPLLETVRFGFTTNSELIEAQAEENDFVRLSSPSEQEQLIYTQSKTPFLDWLFENAFPLVGELTQNVQRYYFMKKPLCGLFLDPKAETELTADPLYSVFTRAVAPHKGRASFSYANGSLYIERLPKMGYKGQLPVIALSDFNTQKTIFYSLTASSQAAEVSEWIGSVLDGKIKPPRKSAPIPEKNDGPVTVVVGDTFEQIVLDPTKDVLLEIYAPWCGHCKQLEPIYKKLGQVFGKYETITIAKIDGTENDHNIPNIQGYPTILFFPANDKRIPLLYKGERNLNDLAAFVRDSVSLPLHEKPVKDEL